MPDPVRPTRIGWLPLLTALVIMFGITLWPSMLTAADGKADHWAALTLFWAMSAGFVSGIGYRPDFRLWRLMLSAPACMAGLALALIRLRAG